MDELRLLEGSYQSAVSALLKKYGPATDDYFPRNRMSVSK